METHRGKVNYIKVIKTFDQIILYFLFNFVLTFCEFVCMVSQQYQKYRLAF